MLKENLKIEKELVKLITLSDSRTKKVRVLVQSSKDFLSEQLREYDHYIRNDEVEIYIGEKIILYGQYDNKLTLRVQNCGDFPYVKRYISSKEKNKLKNEIIKLKNDFKTKGPIYTAIKKSIKKQNYLSNVDKYFYSNRIDNRIDKINNNIKADLKLTVGDTYKSDDFKTLEMKFNGYRRDLDYVKIIKENPKTFQVEYKFTKNDYLTNLPTKVFNKRIHKDNVYDVFRLELMDINGIRNKYNIKINY